MKTKLTLTTVMLLLVCAVVLHGQTTKLIRHTWYELRYYTKQCSSIMGYYVQTAVHTRHLREITRNSFGPDDKAPNGCPKDLTQVYADYNQPFIANPDLQRRVDKGHINPYHAFSFSDAAVEETMVYSNVCPQISHVNEQEWRRVEEEVIKKSKAFGDVKVWTGVLISTSHPKYIGSMMKPDWYWKVISWTENGQAQRDAWLSKNDSTNTHTRAIQAHDTPDHVLKVIHQYYPWFNPGF